MRKQNRKELSRASIGNDDDLLSRQHPPPPPPLQPTHARHVDDSDHRRPLHRHHHHHHHSPTSEADQRKGRISARQFLSGSVDLRRPGRPSYKEVLLMHGETQPSSRSSSNARGGYFSVKSSTPVGQRMVGRCFRCLASDHRVAACRDPVRCLFCWRLGHRAKHCKRIANKGEGPRSMDPIREHRRRGRVASAKAFVPYTEELLRRVKLRRNAFLADVVQPADLGPAPHQTLAIALARRFGGYSHDFFVAKYRERDFVIILPGWVSAELLIRRHFITLDEIGLRCHSWGPYWSARPNRHQFSVWIQLRNVPFECWSTARIASMVSGFGRFIRADENSINLTDLRAYRCRIAVDDINAIPRRLSFVLGEEIVDISVHLESADRTREGGGDQPPPPAPDGINDAPRAGPLGNLQVDGGGGVEEGADEYPDGADGSVQDQRSELFVNRRSTPAGIGGRNGDASAPTNLAGRSPPLWCKRTPGEGGRRGAAQRRGSWAAVGGGTVTGWGSGVWRSSGAATKNYWRRVGVVDLRAQRACASGIVPSGGSVGRSSGQRVCTDLGLKLGRASSCFNGRLASLVSIGSLWIEDLGEAVVMKWVEKVGVAPKASLINGLKDSVAPKISLISVATKASLINDLKDSVAPKVSLISVATKASLINGLKESVAPKVPFFIASLEVDLAFNAPKAFFSFNIDWAGPSAGLAQPALFDFFRGSCSEPKPTLLKISCTAFLLPPLLGRVRGPCPSAAVGSGPWTQSADGPGSWALPCLDWAPATVDQRLSPLRSLAFRDYDDSGGGFSVSSGSRISAPSKSAASPVPRKSLRLARRSGMHALDQAMARKAALRDGPASVGVGLAGGGDRERCADGLRLTSAHQRLKFKSAKCGVLMSDVDVCSFLDFLRSSPAEV